MVQPKARSEQSEGVWLCSLCLGPSGQEEKVRWLSLEQAGREVEAPTVEVDVGGSGRRASQPVEVPADVPLEVPARQPVTPEVVAAPEELEPEPVSENLRPIHVRKPIVRYGVEEQLNIAEEVIASALCAAELEEPKTMNEARKRPDASKWLQVAQEEMVTHQAAPGKKDHWKQVGLQDQAR